MIDKIRKLFGMKCPLFPKAKVRYLRGMLTKRIQICQEWENLKVDGYVHHLNQLNIEEQRTEFFRKRVVAEHLLMLLDENDSNDYNQFMLKLKEM